MDTIICSAGEQDAQALGDIHAASWKAAYRGIVPQSYLDDLTDEKWTERFREQLLAGTLHAKLLYRGDTPAACVSYGPARDAAMPGWGEIVSLYVRPEYFRHGMGARLLREALEALRRMGFNQYYLWVLWENHNARHFYEKHGFAHDGAVLEVEVSGKGLEELRYSQSI